MIVRFNGGLGNQLFQYAFGRSVATARNEELFFEKQGLGWGSHRAYGLDAYKVINIQFAAGSGPIYREPIFTYDARVYDQPRGTHFIGNWQTEKYFNKDIVRSELSLANPVSEKTQEIAKEIIETPESAFIHVRRTDYLIPSTAAYHGNMTMDYYTKAIAYIKERVPNVSFFVFSDDTDWCRVTFPNYRIIDHNKMGCGNTGPGKEHEDLYLMSLCKHAIIPNSSFGWFGAWFGDVDPTGRIIIAPAQWFLGANLDYSDVVPERWVKLC